jgi:hypothetical protein
MNFQFTSGNTVFTKPVRESGFGLAAADLTGVRAWQRGDFQFNLHTGYHAGENNHYIYVFSGSSAPSRNVPRIFIDGTRAGEYVSGTADLKTRDQTEACALVTNNKALFLKIVKNYYGIR